MPKYMQTEVDKLKKRILALGSLVEDHVGQAVRAFEKRDEVLAEKVIQADQEIDLQEVDVEEECLKVLALHQPVAIDLRFIVAILKINNDLERIGDLAVNIAERALKLSTLGVPDIGFDFQAMEDRTQKMLRESLSSLINMDADLAWRVMKDDDIVDGMNKEVYRLVKGMLHEHPEDTDSLIHILSASRNLERIADHATNICEDVIYMVKGDIVRHSSAPQS